MKMLPPWGLRLLQLKIFVQNWLSLIEPFPPALRVLHTSKNGQTSDQGSKAFQESATQLRMAA
jgi:hypothetical protein